MSSLTARSPAFLVLLLAACGPSQTRSPFDYRTDLGIAVEKNDGACLSIRSTVLSAGQRIQIVTTSKPQSAGEANIVATRDKACTAAGPNVPGLSHFEFKLVPASLEKGAPAIAVAHSSRPLAIVDGSVTGDLDGDGQPESFRSCTSSEGVHLTVWTGKPLEGRRRWHDYYYLGYDVDPSCTDADTEPDTP
jgi:hypothetical protein